MGERNYLFIRWKDSIYILIIRTVCVICGLQELIIRLRWPLRRPRQIHSTMLLGPRRVCPWTRYPCPHPWVLDRLQAGVCSPPPWCSPLTLAWATTHRHLFKQPQGQVGACTHPLPTKGIKLIRPMDSLRDTILSCEKKHYNWHNFVEESKFETRNSDCKVMGAMLKDKTLTELEQYLLTVLMWTKGDYCLLKENRTIF